MRPLNLFNTILLIFIAILGNLSISAQNILTNGDFENGGSGNGFLVHDYTLINPLNGISNPGTYARTTNPVLMNSNFISGGDHTSGSGNMLVIDGATQINRFFWTTGNTGGAIGGFTAGTTYTFSFWIKSVSNQVTDANTRANIGVFFVNANNIIPQNLTFLAPLPAEGWQQVTYAFVATANNVMVRLQTLNAGALGNDFAVDDFSISVGGLPLVGDYTLVNPTCPDSNNGSITVSLSGGSIPYGTYNLTGTATQSNNNGIFTGLAVGTYNVTVTDAAGAVYTASNIILAAPNELVVSDDSTICIGSSTTLTASGGAGNYIWTAIPEDLSLPNTSVSSVNVNPNQTTVYTVASGTASNTENLIVNGNFSQGNVGFTTGYTQVDNPNPFGVQSSYNIVTNPSQWFTPFSSCADHTTGNGNMMVFDGATEPTGTTIVWCNENIINVLPNTNYTFTYHVTSVSPQNTAEIEVTINGFPIGLPIPVSPTTCLWTAESYVWNSGNNTTAQICMFNRETAEFGNDFALDDISFTETLTCYYEKTITVTVTPLSLPIFDEILPICQGDVIENLPLISNNNIEGNWTPALNNQTTTLYTFTPLDGQCSDISNLTIEIQTLPVFTISEQCNGINYTLSFVENGESNVNTSYEWFNASNNLIGNNETVVVSATGLYKLRVTRNGCSNEETINVLNTLCSIPKGISPNNDNYNDFFDLEGFNVKKLQVFNRYGKEVYTKNNYVNEWNGFSNSGQDLPDGTYFYVIDFENVESKTGWVYINREQ